MFFKEFTEILNPKSRKIVVGIALNAIGGGTAAEDSTADKTFDVTVTLTAASANYTWTTHKGTVWAQ